jgi:hypothetical protein
MKRGASSVHIVVLRHFEKSDPDAVYYGSLREAVRAVEPGTRLFSVWGAVFNAELARFEPEDISEDFLAAWALTRRETLEQDYWSGDPKFEYGGRPGGLARYLDHALCPPEFVLSETQQQLRHHRACPGDPRLCPPSGKAWMAGINPAMTKEPEEA